eukprot:g9694.t1
MSGVTYLNTLLKNLAKRNRKYLNSEKRASVCLILRLQDNRNSSSNSSYNNNNTARKNIDEVDIASLNLYDKNENQIIIDPNNFANDRHNDLECLFIKRAIIQQDPWSGQVALPGGKQEEQDQNSDYNTAIRETREEIGIDLSNTDKFHYLGQLDDRQITGRGKVIKGFAMIPHIFLQTPGHTRPKIKREKAEVAGVRWVDIGVFNENNIQWDLIERENYKGSTYLFPSIDLPTDGDVTKTDHLNFHLWGLTYGVTSDLISLMGKNSINETQYKFTNENDPPYSDIEDEPGSKMKSIRN